MLISQSLSEPAVGQGSPPMDFAELRRGLAVSSVMDDGNRQRLVGLVRKLARVRALGGEYLQIELSEHAARKLSDNSPV